VTLKHFAIVFVTVSALPQSSILAQSGPALPVPPVFDVASIKPSGPRSVRGSDGGPGSKDPSRYIYGVASLGDLIEVAWKVRPFQISSAAPLDRQNFDLAANVPEGTSKELFLLMLQNLLTERFGLKVHIESRQFPAYELVVAKNGIKMKETIPGEPNTPLNRSASSNKDGAWPELPPDVPNVGFQLSQSEGFEVVRLKAEMEPLSVLVRYLPTPDNLPVVDRTGLTGKYSFKLEYARELSGGSPGGLPPAPLLFKALPEQLGLQILSKRLPFNVVVVDSFNKVPTEN
jgi:uncharacterized protein (TIGR03435 family)